MSCIFCFMFLANNKSQMFAYFYVFFILLCVIAAESPTKRASTVYLTASLFQI